MGFIKQAYAIFVVLAMKTWFSKVFDRYVPKIHRFSVGKTPLQDIWGTSPVWTPGK